MLELLNPRPDLISKDLWAQIQHQARMAAALLVLEERCNGMQREQAMVFAMLDRQKTEQRDSMETLFNLGKSVLSAFSDVGQGEDVESDGEDESAAVNPSDGDMLTVCARTYCSAMKRPELWAAVHYRVSEDLLHEGVSTDALGVYSVIQRVSGAFQKVAELTSEEGEE